MIKNFKFPLYTFCLVLTQIACQRLCAPDLRNDCNKCSQARCIQGEYCSKPPFPLLDSIPENENEDCKVIEDEIVHPIDSLNTSMQNNNLQQHLDSKFTSITPSSSDTSNIDSQTPLEDPQFLVSINDEDMYNFEEVENSQNLNDNRMKLSMIQCSEPIFQKDDFTHAHQGSINIHYKNDSGGWSIFNIFEFQYKNEIFHKRTKDSINSEEDEKKEELGPKKLNKLKLPRLMKSDSTPSFLLPPLITPSHSNESYRKRSSSKVMWFFEKPNTDPNKKVKKLIDEKDEQENEEKESF